LAEHLSERLGDAQRAQVKWPNDVLVDGSKVAGILLEGAAQADGACRWLVVGIGVNLARSPGPAASYPTIDLTALGLSLDPDATLTSLLAALASALPLWETRGFAPFRERWLARAAGRGQPIELRLGHGAVKGIFVDVDASGALCARLPTGEIQRHAAGELVLV
jgi:BirA family biotin operon repressor/biotin-[acetyl-CoA-carboxylase] ligase